MSFLLFRYILDDKLCYLNCILKNLNCDLISILLHETYDMCPHQVKPFGLSTLYYVYKQIFINYIYIPMIDT